MKDFPVIVDPFVQPKASATVAPASAPAQANQASQADEQSEYSAWHYLVDHIDDFAVAKSLVDHFDAHPNDLHRSEVEIDVFPLYLHAKATLKRQAIAFATAQSAVEKARKESRSVRSVVQRFGRHWVDAGRLLMANSHISTVALATIAYYVMTR